MSRIQARMTIPDKLDCFRTIPKRFKAAIGGRGGAKSRSVAQMKIQRCQMLGHRVLCVRELQNSIDDSVHALMKRMIKFTNAPGFEIQKSAIFNRSGGEIKYRGLARNPDAVKSYDDFDSAWGEEAQSLSQDSIKLLTPTIREMGSEIWFTANPMSSADPFSKRFIEPFIDQLRSTGYYEDKLHLIVWVNYTDNPWFPQDLELERQWDLEHLSKAEYDHIWLGEYNDTIPRAIIKPEWFDAAINAHVKLGFDPLGIEVVAHDPADEGDDKPALVYRHGSVVKEAEDSDITDVNDGCDWALSRANQKKADLFTWDSDGMGVSLKRQVRDALKGKKIDHQMFKGSNTADRPGEIYQGDSFYDLEEKKRKTNKETFKNKRAQYYWYLRDRFYNTWQAVEKGKYIDPELLISLDPGIVQLNNIRAEVCRVPLKHNSSGLIQIMDKETMKREGIKSPNIADALMMSFVAPELVDDVNLNFKSIW